jgi:hypothetical protein
MTATRPLGGGPGGPPPKGVAGTEPVVGADTVENASGLASRANPDEPDRVSADDGDRGDRGASTAGRTTGALTWGRLPVEGS